MLKASLVQWGILFLQQIVVAVKFSIRKQSQPIITEKGGFERCSRAALSYFVLHGGNVAFIFFTQHSSMYSSGLR